MKWKFRLALVFAFFMAIPMSIFAGQVMMIQVYNNLYNQAATGNTAGMTPSLISAQFYNGATLCDSATVAYRALVSELVGTGSSQKCSTVSSVKIVAGPSSISAALQVYSVTPIVISINAAKFEHSIIVQDLGTGVTGTPAVDGSIAPIFDTTNGNMTAQGLPGYIIQESKLW